MPNPFEWKLSTEDCLESSGFDSAEGMFTRLVIRYLDPETGEEGWVEAVKQDGYPLTERAVPRDGPAAPLSRAEAQELADDAAAVLGGKPDRRRWVTIVADRQLDCSDGERRPASLIEAGDRIAATLILGPESLYVFAVVNEADDALLLGLSDRGDHDRRLDLHLRLHSLDAHS